MDFLIRKSIMFEKIKIKANRYAKEIIMSCAVIVGLLITTVTFPFL